MKKRLQLSFKLSVKDGTTEKEILRAFLMKNSPVIKNKKKNKKACGAFVAFKFRRHVGKLFFSLFPHWIPANAHDG